MSDRASITKALREAHEIVNEVLPWELAPGPRSASAADRAALRQTALKTVLEALLRHAPGFTREEDGDELLTPGQAARMFGVGTSEVAEYADRGILNPVITPGGKRLYPKAEVEAVLALSPEERNARRNPVVDASGEDIERMRTAEGLTWTQIIRRTGLGKTSLMTRHRKWLYERAEALARDGADASRPGAGLAG